VTALRLLAAVGTLGAVVAGGGALLFPRRPASRELAAPAAARPPPPAASPARAPVPEARVSVPPGILARAAGARALGPAPACTPAPARGEGECAPPRDSVEIEWDVGTER
jgi:hypothetical protein